MQKPKLALIPSGYKNGEVYSILPNDGSGDFSFTRNSGGTRVNKQGLIEQMQTYGDQLLNNSDFTSTSDWTVNNTGSAASVIENGYLHINTSSDYTEATQSIGLTAGDTYRVDYEILESTAGTISIIGNGGASTIIPSTVGKHTIEYDAQAVFAIKRTTGSTNIKIAYIKLYKVQYNTPRLDWSDSNCPSLLLENQSTNLYTYSEDFSQSVWNKSNCNVTLTSEVAPNGNANSVYNLTGTSANLYTSGSANIEHTISFYVKSNGQGKDKFRLRLGNNVSVEYTATNEWVRYEFTSTPTSSIFGITTTSAPNNEFDLLIWGGQSEQQSFASSYIPTFSGTSTRLADTCTGSTDATIFNDSEGVLYMEIQALSDDATYRLISISDGSTNKITLGYSNQNNALIAQIISGGSNEVNLEPINVSDITDFNKIAFSYKTNDCKVYVNGSLVATDTNATMPTGLNQLNFDYAYALDFYGRCKDLKYYDSSLTDQELTELTT
jgi:hypothetical protein